MLWPATSWQPGGQGLLLVLRLVTNLPSPSQPEVPKQYTYTATAITAMACPDAGPSTLAGAGLTRFICVNCSATRRLSSRRLFQGSIRPPCAATSAPPRPASPLTSAIKRSTLRLCPVTSWRGWWGGWSSAGGQVRHQPPGTTIYIYIYYNYVLYQKNAAGIVVKVFRH
jgi:hypothetical protein